MQVSHVRLVPLLLFSTLVLIACAETETPEPITDSMTTAPTHAIPWQPLPGTTFQWHLTDLPVDQTVDAEVYDIDLFDNEASVVAALHARGRKVICYISVGSWEDWRPDAGLFPEEVLGRDYEGWPGERWLDIRQMDKLAPIMRARLDLCAAKGFDAVEPDNIDIYTNNTGFPLTYQDQLNYARWLADEAHARGLGIGIKNAPDMVADSLPFFDFAITEDCFYYGWCREMLPFIQAGKAIFAVEYTDMDVDFEAACRFGREHKITFLLKNRDLDAWRQTCP